MSDNGTGETAPAPAETPVLDARLEGGGSGPEVRLAAFEGPLDLLLHLIRSNQMDVFDIPVVEVARQYADYIDLMREMDLEIAGEFLLMAATLAHIKSRLLLPVEKVEGEDAEDPRAELTRQLVDHQKYRMAAENLQALDAVRSLVWVRPARSFPEFQVEPELVVDLYALMGAFKRLVDQLSAEQRLRTPRERVSVAEKIEWIRARLESAESMPFLELMGELRSRAEMIATFLALLELVRQRAVVAHQRTPLGEIWISRGAPAPAAAPAVSGPAASPADSPVESPVDSEDVP